MVTVLDWAPLTMTLTGTADPGATLIGTSALIWYTPTKPGASPAKVQGACVPPIITVGSAGVGDDAPAAASPVDGWFKTGPNPVPYISMYCPRAMGVALAAIWPCRSTTAPCPVPAALTV